MTTVVSVSKIVISANCSVAAQRNPRFHVLVARLQHLKNTPRPAAAPGSGSETNISQLHHTKYDL